MESEKKESVQRINRKEKIENDGQKKKRKKKKQIKRKEGVKRGIMKR